MRRDVTKSRGSVFPGAGVGADRGSGSGYAVLDGRHAVGRRGRCSYCLISRCFAMLSDTPERLAGQPSGLGSAPGTQLVETCYARAWYGLEYSGWEWRNIRATIGFAAVASRHDSEDVEARSTTLPQYVGMLAKQRGRSPAARSMPGGCNCRRAGLPAEVLVHLSVVSHDAKLGMEQQLLDRAEGSWSFGSSGGSKGDAEGRSGANPPRRLRDSNPRAADTGLRSTGNWRGAIARCGGGY